jgi:hypothetical protein
MIVQMWSVILPFCQLFISHVTNESQKYQGTWISFTIYTNNVFKMANFNLIFLVSYFILVSFAVGEDKDKLLYFSDWVNYEFTREHDYRPDMIFLICVHGVSDFESLTPNHLLLQRQNIALPPGSVRQRGPLFT